MTAPDMSVKTDNGRYYHQPGKYDLVPSITNVIGILDKPGIAPWGYRKCGEFVAKNKDSIMGLTDEAAIVDLVRGAPYRKTQESSVRGDLIHDWIARRIITKGAEPTTEEIDAVDDKGVRGMWLAFLKTEEAYQIEWLYAETTVWSDTYQYAGTIDWMANVMGILTLGDTKSGNNVYPEVALQIAAAANADYAFDDNGVKFQLPTAERFAVLHIRPTFARLSPLDHIDEAFEAFVGLRQAFRWKTTLNDQTIKYSPKIEVR